ncbi:MAG: PEP-CTERM sorting domain-containing protein [Vicinamibacterales bacterium]
MKRMSVVLGILALAMGLSAKSAQALPIVGELSFNGDVRVSATAIDWLPLGGGSGILETGQNSDGYFVNIVNPATSPRYVGMETDLTGQILPLTNFLYGFEERPTEVLSEYDDLSFTLTSIVAPVAPLCTGFEAVNVSCKFGDFTLKNTGNGVALNFEVLGHFIDMSYGDDGSLNKATGAYTTQLTSGGGVTRDIAFILSTIGGGGSITATYSADFIASDATVPEPATMITFGLGSLLVGARARRKAKKAQQL